MLGTPAAKGRGPRRIGGALARQSRQDLCDGSEGIHLDLCSLLIRECAVRRATTHWTRLPSVYLEKSVRISALGSVCAAGGAAVEAAC